MLLGVAKGNRVLNDDDVKILVPEGSEHRPTDRNNYIVNEHNSRRISKFNDISKALNDQIKYIEEAKKRYSTGYGTTEEPDSGSFFSNDNNMNVEHDAHQENRPQEVPHHYKIPSHILRVNKDMAVSLNVKPTDRYFVFWFALSSYFPLAASCLGPLANMISIAALVDRWKMDSDGNYVNDPPWVLIVNSFSIVFGTISDISLIMNFSQHLSYLVAQTISITGWLIASILLVSIIVAEHVYVFKNPKDGEKYHPTEGYYYAILTAYLYFVNSFLLLCNLIGYLMDKYSNKFNLDTAQRGLIFHTLSFATWLSIGAAAFTRLNSINYGTSLYFCVVSVTTVGLGDIVPESNGAKAFVLVYALIGLLILGLIVATVRQMVLSNNEPILFWSHVEKRREKLYNKYKKIFEENYRKQNLNDDIKEEDDQDVEEGTNEETSENQDPQIDQSNKDQTKGSNNDDENDVYDYDGLSGQAQKSPSRIRRRRRRKNQSVKLEDISDEYLFKIMEVIRRRSSNYQRFLSLLVTLSVFISFWLIGAVAFKFMEGWSYFDSAYFCFLCLLTIGYGAPSPKNAFARAFFVCWALGAVPLNTILISNIGDTLFIICVDYSDKIMNYVFAADFIKYFSSAFKNSRATLDDLELALSVSSTVSLDATDAPGFYNQSSLRVLDDLSAVSTRLQSVMNNEAEVAKSLVGKPTEFSSVGENINILKESNVNVPKVLENKVPLHASLHVAALTESNARVLKEILRNQRNMLELIEILDSIKLILITKNSGSKNFKKISHPYKDWSHLVKLIYSTGDATDLREKPKAQGKAEQVQAELSETQKAEQFLNEAEYKMFWISENSPLKYPLDEDNYFLYRYIRVLDLKMNELLRSHVRHYNDCIELIKQRYTQEHTNSST